MGFPEEIQGVSRSFKGFHDVSVALEMFKKSLWWRFGGSGGVPWASGVFSLGSGDYQGLQGSSSENYGGLKGFREVSGVYKAFHSWFQSLLGSVSWVTGAFTGVYRDVSEEKFTGTFRGGFKRALKSYQSVSGSFR